MQGASRRCAWESGGLLSGSGLHPPSYDGYWDHLFRPGPPNRTWSWTDWSSGLPLAEKRSSQNRAAAARLLLKSFIKLMRISNQEAVWSFSIVVSHSNIIRTTTVVQWQQFQTGSNRWSHSFISLINIRRVNKNSIKKSLLCSLGKSSSEFVHKHHQLTSSLRRSCLTNEELTRNNKT